jgi:STE24 endopeptidase
MRSHSPLSFLAGAKMKKLAILIAIILFPACPIPAHAATSRRATTAAAQSAESQAPVSTGSDQQPPQKPITAYTLPPALARKAHTLARIAFWGVLVEFVYSLIVLLLVLKWRLAPKFRDRAEKSASNRFLQAAVFTTPLVLVIAVLNIPLDIVREHILRRFGISVQSWSSWALDWAKGELLTILLAIFLVWIFYARIRRSPRYWWFRCWLASLPIVVLLVFLQPVVVDPLFHKFEPLEHKDPALTTALEKMVQRAGEQIPPERMFWMGASEKTTSLNAYVTGIGASKRIVVWDTTIKDMTTPQIVFVAGHEMGHYVLNHIPKGLAFAALSLFILDYLLFLTVDRVLARWGAGWGIRNVGDYASLPALLFLIVIFAFLGAPIGNTFSRYVEHQADQYGLEVTHGLTPDSAQVAAQSFQKLGEIDLADPDPNPVEVFLFYDHPAVPDRIRFSLSYDPWSKGEQPEFVH